MAIRHFCDGCGKEMTEPKIDTSVQVANIDIADLATGKMQHKLLCPTCTKVLNEAIEKLRKDNNLQEIKPGLDMKFMKK